MKHPVQSSLLKKIADKLGWENCSPAGRYPAVVETRCRFAAILQKRPDRDLDYAGFVGDEAAHRIRAEMPALRQLADGVVLIEGNGGSFKLHRSPYCPGWQPCLSRRHAGRGRPVPSRPPEDDRECEFVELSGGDVDLQLRDLAAPRRMHAGTVAALLGGAALDFVELHTSVRQHEKIGTIVGQAGRRNL